MTTDENGSRSAFAWNPGGWFGTQIGGTLWMLILGLVLFRRDSLTALLCLGSFLALNVWGLGLWGWRKRLSAYTALQGFLLAASVLIALVVVVVNLRGLSQPPEPGGMVSTYLPYWTVVVAPALMSFFFLRERRGRGRSVEETSGS